VLNETFPEKYHTKTDGGEIPGIYNLEKPGRSVINYMNTNYSVFCIMVRDLNKVITTSLNEPSLDFTDKTPLEQVKEVKRMCNYIEKFRDRIFNTDSNTFKNIMNTLKEKDSIGTRRETSAKMVIENNIPNVKVTATAGAGKEKDVNENSLQKLGAKIVAFLNSDDLLTPNAVEQVIKSFEVNKDINVVYGSCSTIDEFGTQIKKSQGKTTRFKKLLEIGMLPYIFQPACFIRTKAIRRDFFVDETLNYAFDYELLLYCFKRGISSFINYHVACYRVHNQAKSQNLKAAYLEKLNVQKRYLAKVSLNWYFKKYKALL
jgi:hypothetical protein